ncbi:unnamed protein product [Polarella glacialis]|uniref:HAT C-terminal dimerisation domain-containing protein n=1 Tax=Polarella glacialis TaxID=89957 RepID=A0A813G9X9_POLGL|nr:unnamed protein product [Polarella glacialis]
MSASLAPLPAWFRVGGPVLYWSTTGQRSFQATVLGIRHSRKREAWRAEVALAHNSQHKQCDISSLSEDVPVPKEEGSVQVRTEPNSPDLVIPSHRALKLQLQKWDSLPANPSADPLEFWQSYQFEAPHLALIARAVFAIPGSSAALERAFSHAGRAVNPKRARLSVKRAIDLIFVHENIIRNVL